ncbi:sulfatase [Verrucomicrobiaceae bacterium N1E253]|uniref:Sulfatase n=1 Tax=Oceaniferula marina TaxID=2748318 RepID=A0A851GH67_9BACT|nr:sulfatase [Oceaniferula marina]NWK56539.1 sulfatase [Oceaniferula marina]
MKKNVLFIKLLTLALLSSISTLKAGSKSPNILMFAIDDLRPELRCYGATHIHSPSIDKLADEGFLFNQTYCQVAVCGASRASLLSGSRPETAKVWDYYTPMRKRQPDVLSMPQHFKQHGYTTISLGKVYHAKNDDFPKGWSEQPWRPGGGHYQTQAAKDAMIEHPRQKGRMIGPATENGGRVPDNVYGDGKVADEAVARLEGFAKQPDQPFFLAVGFSKPHLPFVAPGKYWDLYDRKTIAVPSRENAKNSPKYAHSTWGELKSYADIDAKAVALDDDKTRELIHGYYASVSYTDRNVGHVLDALEKLGLKDNTIVILWGDHGWYLGDFGDWCKHTNEEIATRVPMIIRVPGKTRGQKTDALAEFVDIYPSLCELAGIPVPKHCQGHSFHPLFDNPGLKWKQAAFSQYHKRDGRRKLSLRGTSVRTQNWRYTEWVDRKTNKIDAVELYDLKNDPGATVSVHNHPENSPVLKQHAEFAKKSRTGVAPPE